MVRFIIFACLISTPAFARYEETVQEGQRWFASEEYKRQLAADAQAKAVREAPDRNRKLMTATVNMAKRFHGGLASRIVETHSENGLYILRVDFRTGNGYDCKGSYDYDSFMFECVHTVNFDQKIEYYSEGFILGSPKRKR